MAAHRKGANEMSATEEKAAAVVVTEGSDGATVVVSEMEYNSLKAAAELVRHPEVLFRTLQALAASRGQSLADAFNGLSSLRSKRRRTA